MIHILTGPVHSGKTTFLQRLTAELKHRKIAVDGFLSLSVKEREEFIGYDLFDLQQESSTPFIRKTGKEKWQRIGDYYFIPETLDMAQNIILRSREADIKVIDEVGPLELHGKGLWPALEKTVSLPAPDLVCVIRNALLETWIEKLKPKPAKIFDITEEDLYPKMLQYFSAKIILTE